MQLSPHFTLRELTRSQTAARRGIDNTPPPDAVSRLRSLCLNVLEPVRAKFGPVYISSGYRCEKLCLAIGSKVTSQHAKGEAGDFEVVGVSNFAVATWIASHIDFDQLILECWRPNDPNAGWLHISYRAERLRHQCLTFDGQRYFDGLRP